MKALRHRPFFILLFLFLIIPSVVIPVYAEDNFLKKGDTLFESGNLLEAKSFFIRSLAEYPDIRDYSLYRIFLTAKKEGDLRLAEKTFEDIELHFGYSRWYGPMILDMGSIYANAGFHKKSIATLKKYASSFPSGRNITKVLLLLCEELIRDKQKAEAKNILTGLWYDHPESPEADRAEAILMKEYYNGGNIRGHVKTGTLLRRCDELKKTFHFSESIKEYDYLFEHSKKLSLETLTDVYLGKGEALEKLKQYKKASILYESLLKRLGKTGKRESIELAGYRLANAYFQGSDDEQFLLVSKKAVEKESSSPYGLKTAYLIFKFYKNAGDVRNALDYISMMLKANTAKLSSFNNAELLWEAGFINYLASDYPEALRLFNLSANSSEEKGVQYCKSFFWAGKAAEKSGEADAAALFKKGVSSTSYYGKLCDLRVNDKVLSFKLNRDEYCGSPDALRENINDNEIWDIAEKQIKAGKVLLFFKRAKTLKELGFQNDCFFELKQAVKSEETFTSDKVKIFANLFVLEGDYIDAVPLLARLSEAEKEKAMNDREISQVLYPLAFYPYVKKYCESEGLDPFFVLSVMRQESMFNSDALSPAGAVGLMQVMPATARKVNKKPIGREDLFSPETNVRIGVNYLSGLIKENNGNIHYALSAYNAGESKLDEWIKKSGSCEPEEFIERITYRETCDYVKRILSNYLTYRSIYCN
ncbi:MAG: lytic transglycosylase domain-containing protein [Candidatus Schekmanbacteria bacterium]|nr:lytic transglycosylase domain-containing protein [Candidatus Schekmanbacteria bacterium]